MIFNSDKSQFWCNECQKWIGTDPCEFMIFNDAIVCMKEHFCGYYHDIFPCEFFIMEHQKPRCKCEFQRSGGEFAITTCNGKEEDCNYLLAKRCYEDDLREEK